jgi:hypothetical protein
MGTNNKKVYSIEDKLFRKVGEEQRMERNEESSDSGEDFHNEHIETTAYFKVRSKTIKRTVQVGKGKKTTGWMLLSG